MLFLYLFVFLLVVAIVYTVAHYVAAFSPAYAAMIEPTFWAVSIIFVWTALFRPRGG